jgi:hypothetical protein
MLAKTKHAVRARYARNNRLTNALFQQASDIRKSVNRTHSDVRFLSGIARRNLLKLW